MTRPRTATFDNDSKVHQAPIAAAASQAPVASGGSLQLGLRVQPSGSALATRTSGTEERSCRVCGASITGRRRNGFCSDRCRMRLSRVEKAKRLQQAVTNAERAFEVLREELGIKGG